MLLIAPANALVFKPLLRVLDERDARTAGTRASAARLEQEAAAILARYEQAVRETREEGERGAARCSPRCAPRRSARSRPPRRDAEGRLETARGEIAASLERRARRCAARRRSSRARPRRRCSGGRCERARRSRVAAARARSPLAAPAPRGAKRAAGLLCPTINFVLLIAVLVYFARKPIQTFFADRRAAIRKELDDAAALQRRAEERYAQWQRRLVDLERELEEIRAGAQERAEAERASLLADARAAAERIRADAANAVEQELRRARAGLREEASELAVELAAGILREQVTAQDRDRLIDEFIERVERAPEARK